MYRNEISACAQGLQVPAYSMVRWRSNLLESVQYAGCVRLSRTKGYRVCLFPFLAYLYFARPPSRRLLVLQSLHTYASSNYLQNLSCLCSRRWFSYFLLILLFAAQDVISSPPLLHP